MRLIKDSLVVLGDSFSDYDHSWADILSQKLNMPIIKYTIPGGSNDLIFHKFMSDDIICKNCLVIFQSSSIYRFVCDSSDNTSVKEYLKNYNLENKVSPSDLYRVKDRIFLLTQFCKDNKKLLVETPIDLSRQFHSYSFIFQQHCDHCNLLNKWFISTGNKFAFLLGLFVKEIPESYHLKNMFVTCPTISYNGLGIDQFIIDIEEIDNSFHPTDIGHRRIAEEIVLPQLKELNLI